LISVSSDGDNGRYEVAEGANRVFNGIIFRSVQGAVGGKLQKDNVVIA